MKKLSVFKIIQLSILAVITLISVFFPIKARGKAVRVFLFICYHIILLIWIILIASFCLF